MSIPSYKNFIEPILRFLAGKDTQVHVQDLREAAASCLNLTEEDRVACLQSGKKVYEDRTAWALNTLKHSHLVDSPIRGMWCLTSQGREFAQDHEQLTDSDLNGLVAIARGKQPPRELLRHQQYAEFTGDRRAYRLTSRPIGIGGQCEVYEATRKSDGRIFVLKRILDRGSSSAAERMKREINILAAIDCDGVMPIVDWDSDKFTWYVMPKGRRSMADLPRPLLKEVLAQILRAVITALAAAHEKGQPHRDIKPGNVIELIDKSGQACWVLGDWGLTRRPLGETTTPLTKTEHVLGTDGFAPPEAYRQAHLVDAVGDIYSLGQLIAWATGADPIPNIPAVAAEPWTSIVERLNQPAIENRVQTIDEVRDLLEEHL